MTGRGGGAGEEEKGGVGKGKGGGRGTRSEGERRRVRSARASRRKQANLNTGRGVHSSQVEHTLLSLAPMHITGNVWGLWIYGLTHMRGGAGVEGGGERAGR